MRTGFKATILETSTELTAKERIKIKDTSNALSIDELSQEYKFNGNKFIIDVEYFAVLHIENGFSDDKEYDQLVLVDKESNKFVTGSKSFMENFIDIAEEMKEAGEHELTIEVVRKESKNYKGKEFLTCSIV